MTNTEKRSLYESIMRDVAKTVKSRITRLDESDSFGEYDKLRKNKMFDKSVDELGKKLYSKAVTAFDNDQINDVVSILNSLYYNGRDEDIIYQLVYLLNELI